LKADSTSRMVYLPAGTWFDFWTGEKIKGGTMTRVEAPMEKVPLYVRAGSIIPMGEEMNYVGEKPGSPLTLAMYPDENGQASSNLYEDDDTSPAYLRGTFRRRTLKVSGSSAGYTVNLGASEGNYQSPRKNLLLSFPSTAAVHSVTANGKPLESTSQSSTGPGWYKDSNSRWVIQISDDNKAQTIEIR
jgi:alpha-glucosidase (family GH31 glycosyl hydrolase)